MFPELGQKARTNLLTHLAPTSAIKVRSFFFIETTAPNPTTELTTMAQGEEGERPNQAHPRRPDLANQRAAARERKRQSEAAATTTVGGQFPAALIPNRQHLPLFPPPNPQQLK
jgi:hypothetical protein